MTTVKTCQLTKGAPVASTAPSVEPESATSEYLSGHEYWEDAFEECKEGDEVSRKTSQELRREMVAQTPYAYRSNKAMGRSRGKGKSKSARIVSKAFNPVAGRPNRFKSIGDQGITVFMSLTTSAWITTSITVPVFRGQAFTVSGFAASSPYLTVFDQYKIDELEVWIEPVISQSSAIALVSNYSTAIDLDDANTPTAYDNVQDHQSAIISNGEAGHYHKWQPHVAIAAYSGAFTSFANIPAGWNDVASPNIQHYGLKYATNSATSIPIIYSLSVRARVSFRSAGL